jgi:hypothetical protein
MTTFVYTGNNTLKQREAENVPLPELEDDDLEESETEEQIYTQENIDVCETFCHFKSFSYSPVLWGKRVQGLIWGPGVGGIYHSIYQGRSPFLWKRPS